MQMFDGNELYLDLCSRVPATMRRINSWNDSRSFFCNLTVLPSEFRIVIF